MKKSETLGSHMTIKRAKELARYLPRSGREICVLDAIEVLTFFNVRDEEITGKFRCQYFLQNTSGKYSVYKYCDTSKQYFSI